MSCVFFDLVRLATNDTERGKRLGVVSVPVPNGHFDGGDLVGRNVVFDVVALGVLQIGRRYTLWDLHCDDM